MSGYSCDRCGRKATRSHVLCLSPEHVAGWRRTTEDNPEPPLTGRMICDTCADADDHRRWELRYGPNPERTKSLNRILKRSPLS